MYKVGGVSDLLSGKKASIKKATSEQSMFSETLLEKRRKIDFEELNRQSDTKITTESSTEKQPAKTFRTRNYSRHRVAKIVAEEVEARTLFVGNVGKDVDKKTLKAVFSPIGKVESLRFRMAPVVDLKIPKKVADIKRQFHEKRSTKIAYVVFVRRECAVQAATDLNNIILGGRHLRVDLAANAHNSPHDVKRSVFIGNVPFDAESEQVREFFSQCGEIENVRLIRDSKTTFGKGFGYVLFKEQSGVNLALKLSGHSFRGREIRVKHCQKKPKINQKRGAPIMSGPRFNSKKLVNKSTGKGKGGRVKQQTSREGKSPKIAPKRKKIVKTTE